MGRKENLDGIGDAVAGERSFLIDDLALMELLRREDAATAKEVRVLDLDGQAGRQRAKELG